MQMSAEWWDDADGGHPTYWEKNVSQCQSVHQKSNVDWRGIEGRTPRLGAGDSAPQP